MYKYYVGGLRSTEFDTEMALEGWSGVIKIIKLRLKLIPHAVSLSEMFLNKKVW